MKHTLIAFALLTSGAFAAQPDLVPLQMELSRLNQQLQIMQAQQAKPAASYVPGETVAQRSARHAQVLAEAEAAYKADWQAKNPLLPSFRAPKLHKQLADAALAASDAQEAANAGRQGAPARSAPDPQIAAMQRRIKALEAKMATQQSERKKK